MSENTPPTSDNMSARIGYPSVAAWCAAFEERNAVLVRAQAAAGAPDGAFRYPHAPLFQIARQNRTREAT
jgi:hypothetical protein